MEQHLFLWPEGPKPSPTQLDEEERVQAVHDSESSSVATIIDNIDDTLAITQCPKLATAGAAVIPWHWVPPPPADDYDVVSIRTMVPPVTPLDPSMLLADLLMRQLVVDDTAAIGCIAPARVFNKGVSKGGIIVDRRVCNSLEPTPPSMDGRFVSVNSLRASLAVMLLASQPWEHIYMCCADVASAYWASVLPYKLKFSLFVAGEVRHLATHRMLFGHSWGPYSIHNFLAELAAPVKLGIEFEPVQFHQIIDDMLWLSRCQRQLVQAVLYGVGRVKHVGYSLSEGKTQLIPRYHTVFLGMHVGRLGLTVDLSTWHNVVQKCIALLAGHKVLFYHKFMRLCGWMLHICTHPLSRLKLGSLYVMFNRMGLLPSTSLVCACVHKILVSAILPMGCPPVPMPWCCNALAQGRPKFLLFCDAAVTCKLAGCVMVNVATRDVVLVCQFGIPLFACASQQDAELYGVSKCIWIARVRDILGDICVVTDNSAVWWQLTQPRVAIHSALRRKLLSRVFKLPFTLPVCVWVGSLEGKIVG